MGLQYNSPMIPGRLSEMLGSGSFFEIYEVEGKDPPLALKRPKPSLQGDPRIRRLLANEAKTLETLGEQEHFPRFFGQGEENGQPYLLMEKLEGLNLDQALLLGKGERIDPSLAAGIGLEIAEALQSLHRASLVHGDLKPHNVMVLRDGRVVLIDLSLEGGTFSYMPPERMDSKKVEPASDLFALGLILYELLIGEPLVPGEKKMEVYFKMKDLRRVPPILPSAIPPALARMIDKSLKAGIEGGYSDAAEMCRDFSVFLESLNSNLEASQRSEWLHRLETRSA
jgi:serine/threonine protein kinase